MQLYCSYFSAMPAGADLDFLWRKGGLTRMYVPSRAEHRNKGVGGHWSAISVTGPGLMQHFHIKGVL